MNQLLVQLPALDARDQEQLVLESAADATIEELIEVLLGLRLTSWIEHFVIKALVERGPQIFDPVARALLADPLAPGAAALGETLVRLLDDDNLRDERVVPTLVQAAEAALAAGAGTRELSSYILLLRDCSNIVGPLPGTAELVRRLHEVAATEADPYPFGDITARWLTEGHEDLDEKK